MAREGKASTFVQYALPKSSILDMIPKPIKVKYACRSGCKKYS